MSAIEVAIGIGAKDKKKAARTVNCPCREASDATCDKNLAARAKASTATELIVPDTSCELLAANAKFREKTYFLKN
jgi:hypothetical protein